MFDFFNQVLGFIQTVFDFFISLVESLILGISLLVSSIDLPLLLVGYVPPILGSAIVVCFSIYIIKFLIGR